MQIKKLIKGVILLIALITVVEMTTNKNLARNYEIYN